jgi:choline monooxygenase
MSTVTLTLPARWYSDPAVYERERRSVFGASWHHVGHVGQLVNPGDYVATTIAGWPIVVVTGGDGSLRAFHNVCRHRAGPLVWDGTGTCGASFVCRYHGWAYDLDGTLRSARDFGDGAPADDLWPVSVDTWRGLVFANPDGQAPPLLDWLGGFADQCEDFPLEHFTVATYRAEDIDANWKAYADNYLEGYHLPLVHPELTRQVDAKRYEVEVGDGGMWCVHRAAPRDGAPVTGRWLWHWPNLALNLYPDGMNVERFLPISPARTTVAYTYMFRAGGDADASVAMSVQLLAEDRRIVEAVQRNLDAGLYDTGSLSPRHEGAVAGFHDRLRAAVGEVSHGA